MKKIIVAVFTALIMTLYMSIPAQAATGWLSRAEAQSYCYTGQNTCTANSRASVENICDCTGDFVKSWTNDSGVQREQVNYNNSYGVGRVQGTYRLTDSGTWRIQQINWCNDAGCTLFFGVN